MRHHHNLNRGEITGKAVSATLRLCAVSTSSGAVLLWGTFSIFIKCVFSRVS
jgi:hypothetical protein